MGYFAKNGIISICISHVKKADGYDASILSLVMNQTNREVKFIKVVIMDNVACALIMTISRLLKMIQGLLYNISLKFYAIGIFEKNSRSRKTSAEIGYYTIIKDIKSRLKNKSCARHV